MVVPSGKLNTSVFKLLFTFKISLISTIDKGPSTLPCGRFSHDDSLPALNNAIKIHFFN